MRFQVGELCSENLMQFDQIQNGRLSAIINFNMPEVPDKLCQIVRCSNLQNWHNLENDDDKKLFVHFFNFSDPKNNIHSVQICRNSRWQTINKMGQLLSKFLKHAQEKQSESSSQLCTITVYGLCPF